MCMEDLFYSLYIGHSGLQGVYPEGKGEHTSLLTSDRHCGFSMIVFSANNGDS